MPLPFLLTLVSLPGIFYIPMNLVLTIGGGLLDMLVGYRLGPIGGFRLLQRVRPLVLLGGGTYLFTLWSMTAAQVYVVWMLIYMVFRQFNGAADQERRISNIQMKVAVLETPELREKWGHLLGLGDGRR